MLPLCLLLLGTALAAPDDEPPPGDARVYVAARAAAAVPVGYKGIAQSYGVEIGALTSPGNQIGLRLLWTPWPTEVYGPSTPDQAFGPVLVLAHQFRLAPRFEMVPTLAFGAVFGQDTDTKENVVLPALQIGLGARGRVPLGRDTSLGIGPEIGFIPTLLAPTVALNLSWFGAKPTGVPAED